MIYWNPTKQILEQANITAFIKSAEKISGKTFSNYSELYTWSITKTQSFWSLVWEFCGIIGEPGKVVLQNENKMPGSTWFPQAKLNFAQNLLRCKDSETAIVFWGEDKIKRKVTYTELNNKVSSLAKHLDLIGLKPGDRVAALMPNVPETIIAMLASTSLGAVWSSCSPDFGIAEVLERFEQIQPKILFTTDGYYFKGEKIDTYSKIVALAQNLPSVQQIIMADYINPPSTNTTSKVQSFSDCLQQSSSEIEFKLFPFNHPLYIMFSSGTTGKPKCIVHGAGGTLIEHLKELVLHTDLKAHERIFYQTTCGWMMWNWLVSSLACKATLVLYDGFPLLAEGKILFDLCEKEKIDIFGTNAKYLSIIEKLGLEPQTTHKLSLKSILSTGSPLLPENYDYVYSKISPHARLSSISGGTDIIGCFALGCPITPVYRGELQVRSLGLNVEIYDDSGRSVISQKGELVCTKPFPSMPLGFWGDADGTKYKAAYFERFANVWHHGDFAEITDNAGLIIYGRSDATLNPGGVRIGSAEIYRQVESLPEISESLVIAQNWKDDIRIVLFVKLAQGYTLNIELIQKIKRRIKDNASAFHVPKKIVGVPDIPRTRNGKIVELAVRNVVHNLPVKNLEALANPESLNYFKGLAELDQD